VRQGHGANCSSIGSVVDVLFASAALGGVALAAVLAALGREEVHLAPAPGADGAPEQAPSDLPEEDGA